jgi:hypothetical protein
MKILFVMDRRVNAGSIQAVAQYMKAGEEFGYEIALYGRPDPAFPGVRFSVEVGVFDYVVFVLESGLNFLSGLRMPRILHHVPRDRRAVLDADGMYNPCICVDGYDRNHSSEEDRRAWFQHIELLTNRVFQPTSQPRLRSVLGVPFYGYSPRLGADSEPPPAKNFDILHVAHNWWRWREVAARLAPGLERIRDSLDGVCFVGSWWDAPPAACDPRLRPAFQVDGELFRRLRIQVQPPVPFTDVVRAMSAARINIMTQRPLFRCLRLLTSKYFEIFCADTVPLVMLDPDHAETVYGPAGRELALYHDVAGKLLDVLDRPGRYRELVQEVRCHLEKHHSYRVRLQELVTALKT